MSFNGKAQNSGMPGALEKYQFQPEAWSIPTYSTGEVDESGNFNISIPVEFIKSPSGLSAGFTINYNSNIKYGDPSGWLGLGWSANLGAITRSVQEGIFNLQPNNNLFNDYHPVDYPDLVQSAQWDKVRDIYSLVLPTGESLEFVLGASLNPGYENWMESVPINSTNTTADNQYKWHEFIPMNLKNYKIKGYFKKAVNDYTVIQDITLRETPRTTSTASIINRKDYICFEITTDDGTKYLYSAPTIDTYNSSLPNSNHELFYYINTWRIFAVIPGNIQFALTSSAMNIMNSQYSASGLFSGNESEFGMILYNYFAPSLR